MPDNDRSSVGQPSAYEKQPSISDRVQEVKGMRWLYLMVRLVNEWSTVEVLIRRGSLI